MNDFQFQNLADSSALTGQAAAARQASVGLSQTPVQLRNQSLKTLLGCLQAQRDELLEANTLDLETLRDSARAGFGVKWLKLTPERLSIVHQYLELLIGLPDPLQVRSGTVAQALHSFNSLRATPRGLICGLYEFLPEFPLLLFGLCLKSGNSLWIRGTDETSHTHRFFSDLIQAVLAKEKLDARCFHGFSAEDGTTVQDLTVRASADLLVPYGRTSFVQGIVQEAASPSLRPSIGNCYLFWALSGSGDFVKTIIVDSHVGMPDAVNAIEKVLITPNLNYSLLNVVFHHLREKGFTLKGDEALKQDFPDLDLADPLDWSNSFLSKTVAFKIVDSLGDGIQWINQHSSGHADGIVTDAYRESQQFILGTRTAISFINASPKFSRLSSGYSGGPTIGMMGRGTAWGPIGIESFVKGNHVVHGFGMISQ